MAAFEPWEETLQQIQSLGKRRPPVRRLEDQVKILRALEAGGRQPLPLRDLYRRLHLRKVEFDRAVAPLVRRGLLRREGESLVPAYTSPESLLSEFQGKVHRLGGPLGPLSASPLKFLSLGLLLLASSLGGLALLQGLLPPEPTLLGTPLANASCRGFGVELPGAPGAAEVQVERDGRPLAQGRVALDRRLYLCKEGGRLTASTTLPPGAAGAVLVNLTPLDPYLLVNVTIRGAGTLQEGLLLDFREDNRAPLELLWAEPLRDGLLVVAQNRGAGFKGQVHIYHRNQDGGLTSISRSPGVSLPPGGRVALWAPQGVSYAVLAAPGGDTYLRLNLTGPFGEASRPLEATLFLQGRKEPGAAMGVGA